jgi:hypothetical protein
MFLGALKEYILSSDHAILAERERLALLAWF